jgi:signal transduction histidine kinase
MLVRVPRSFTFRLAITYMSLFGLSVMLLMLFIYWFTATYMLRESDALVETEINDLVERYDTLGLDGLTSLINARLSHLPSGLSVYLLAGQNYYPLAGNLDEWPQASMDSEGWIGFKLVSNEGDIKREHVVRARRFTLPGGYHLLVGRIVSHLVAMEERIAITMAWGLGMMLVLGSAVGWWMSQRMASRIEAINRTNRDIIDGDLSRRIPLQGTNDELDRLASGLNEMLDRIQALMEEVRRVSDNIAHDLRTPLGRLHNQLDNLHSEVERAGLDTSSIEQALSESEGLLSTFNALLRIARIEARSRTEGFAQVDLTALVRDAAEYYEPLAEAREQTLAVKADPAVQLVGDRDLLFQAIANLLDNAIKYTPRGGEVRVTLAVMAPGTAELTVVDTGPGIPPAARQQVFQRFFRLEDSRSTPGNGLGLSLVEAVVHLHGMTIRVSDNSPGTRITLGIPVLFDESPKA